MGKIRQKRHAYHTAAPKLEKEASSSKQECTEDTLSDTKHTSSPFPHNIFGSVSITADMLGGQRLLEGGKESRQRRKEQKRKEYGSLQVEFKAMLQANKKMKKKERPTVNKVFKESTTSVERKKTLEKRKGIAHLGSLADALPTEMKAKRSIKRKPRTSKRFKTQVKEMSDDMGTFLNIMKNSAFVSDPFSTISNHLKMKLEAEHQRA